MFHTLHPSSSSASRNVRERDIMFHFIVESKGRYTLDIFTHNIAIKRQCDKKILQNKDHFSSNIFFPVCIENIYFWTIMLIET
jgi:hypothetical protein